MRSLLAWPVACVRDPGHGPTDQPEGTEPVIARGQARPGIAYHRSSQSWRSVETRRIARLAAFPSTPRLQVIGSADNRGSGDPRSPAEGGRGRASVRGPPSADGGPR